MADFVLIHGSGYRAAVWQETIRTLAALGHRATAPDLPRHPGVTLADQARAVRAALPPGPALLVGHSAGGFPVTAAADDPRLRALVFLCAYVPDPAAPPPGKSVANLRRAQSTQPLRPAIRVDRAAGRYRFDPALAETLLFHDCPAPGAEAARLVAEPIAPQETPLLPPPGAYARPLAYIRCLNDRAIPPETQRRMAQSLPGARDFTLATGHSPFLAAPETLARLLDDFAGSLPDAT